MKVKTLALIAAIFLHGFILNTNAADKEYKCKIRNIYKLSKSGEIDLAARNVPECYFFGVGDTTFSLSKDTGKIIPGNNCPPQSVPPFVTWEHAKDAEGNFQADDPLTPDVDEAWIDNEGDYRIINPVPLPGKKIVVDKGNSDSSFKLVNIDTSDDGFRVLEVFEHNEQKEKPFYSISDGYFYSGICL